MTKEVNAQVTFQKNCEYDTSFINRTIYIEPQNVEIEVTIVNSNQTKYYDDTLEVRAFVYQTQSNNSRKIIKTGRIEFYYQAEDSQKQILINKDNNSCILNSNGVAAAVYRPEKSGMFIAKYIDDKGWYNTTTNFTNFKLNPIPVTIKFIEKPPYIVNLHDSIELKVKVEKKYPRDENDILNYGVVTFLHYLEHFDMDNPNKRVERVIGNPVIVKDGIATIKYIPIQEYDDLEITELIDNTEYIRAVYNYDNDLYYNAENNTYSYEIYHYEEELKTNKWQYYSSANVYTNIAIYKPNSVVLGIDNKTLSSDNMYHYIENESFTVKATLYSNDKPIVLQNDDAKTLTFHVIGTYATFNNNILIEDYKEENFIHNNYELDIEFDEYVRETINGQEIGYFKKTFSNLKPGEYTIQASTNGQIINGEVKIYPSHEDIEAIEEDGHIKYDTDEIRTDTYLDSLDISNILYIKSDYKTIPYTATLSIPNNTVQTNSNISTLNSTLNVASTYKDFFKNKKCYFFDIKNNIKYVGTITNQLKLQPVDDISFNIANDYPIYAYIPAGYYKYNDNYIFIDNLITNQIVIQARDSISLDIDYSYNNNTVYGGVKYTLSCPNMFLEYSQVDLRLEKNSTLVQKFTYYFTRTKTIFHGNFNNLESGAYSIYGYIQETNEKKLLATFTIEKDNITQSLQNTSKIINAHPYGTVELVISSSNQNNLNLLNMNKLHIFLQETTSSYNINTAQETVNYSIKERTNESIKILVQPRTSLQKEWYIGVTYEGDSNFNAITCIPDKFKTVLVTPNISIEYNKIDSAVLTLDNNINNVKVIGKVRYFHDQTPISSECIFITDQYGECIIDSIPNTCNRIHININPQDEDIIEIIESDSFAQLLKATHTVYEMQVDSIYDIYDQYINSNRTCLFNIYDNIETDIIRNII